MNFFVSSGGLSSHWPVVEQAHIHWRDLSAYDDWDDLSAMLFDRIVTESIRWALPNAPRDDFSLPRYGLLFERYDAAFITVLDRARRLAFVGFETAEMPFDRVRVVEVGADCIAQPSEVMDVEGLGFALSPARDLPVLDRLVIEL